MLASHQFFNRLVESFVSEVSRMTPDGCCIASTCDCGRKGMPGRWRAPWPVTRTTMRSGADLGADDVDQSASHCR